jgi:hypothetical protein
MYKPPQRKIPKKEIAKEAQQLLKQGGKTKQEVFEMLVDKYKYSKDVADVLRYIPTTQAIAKYGAWNTVLLVILILTAIISFMPNPTLGILWYVLLIYAVATKRIQYYMWATILYSFFAISFLAIIMYMKSFEIIFHWISLIFLTFFVIPGCILPLWIQKKLCPKPIERKEVYVNAEGNRRLKIVYEFPDMTTGEA